MTESENGVDVVGCIQLVLVIAGVTLGAIGTAIQVTPWLLFFWVPLDLIFILLLVATIATGTERRTE